MSKKGSLKYQLIQKLKQQHEVGYGKSRHIDKLKNGRESTEEKIYSRKSFEKHKSSIIGFHGFLKSAGINRIDNIKKEHVEGYINYRLSEGRAHKTIQADITAINKVLKNSSHYQYTAKELRIEGNRERQNNKFDKKRVEIPEKYVEQVELAKMAGLRRAGIEKIGTNSFYKYQEKYYILTLEKGGKDRLCEVNNKYIPEFEKRYGSHIHLVDRMYDIPQGKTEVKEALNAGTEIYTDKIPSKYSLHIYRAEYALDRFEQLKVSGEYHKVGVWEEHNSFKADKGLFLDLTKNLGHNRTDVLSKYLRSE